MDFQITQNKTDSGNLIAENRLLKITQKQPVPEIP
jgi:hypothetical protein